MTFAADSACSALPVSEAPGATYYNGATYYSQGAPGELWNMLMHHQATYDHNVDAVVGPACSGASNAAAYFAEEFKVPMVSYSATSKSLSGRSPYFFRLSAPDSEKSLRIVDFMASVDWTHVGIISTDTAYGKGMADNIKSDWLAHDSESKVEYRQIIDVDRDDVADKVEEAMSLLDQGSSDAVTRVVVLTGHTNDVGEMLFHIADADVGGTVDSTAYVLTTDSVPLPENIGKPGWPENMRDGIFACVIAEPDTSTSGTMAYQYLQTWKTQAFGYLGRNPNDTDGSPDTIHTYGWNTHDAVVVVARAYHELVNGGGSGTTLRDKIDELTPEMGVSGQVEIDRHTHDRKDSRFDLMNLQGGQWVKVATISPGLVQPVRKTLQLCFSFAMPLSGPEKP